MKRTLSILTLISLAILVIGSSQIHAEETFLTGKVTYLDKDTSALKNKLEKAENLFTQTEAEGYYFTGYKFLSRSTIRIGDKWDPSKPYGVYAKSGEIKIRRSYDGKTKYGFSTEMDSDTSAPAGILLLHEVKDRKTRILDSHVIDLERKCDFSEEPLYWLGKVDNQESFDFLKTTFESSDEDLQKNLLFMISLHDQINADDYLKGIALGSYKTDVRKNAIFWLGNSEGEKSLPYLKEIYKKVKSTKLKKHVVFSLSLSDEEDAINEMIRIAKKEESQEVRKNAIFWLGNKASQKAVALLKDVVYKSDETTEVKKSAVFAISQLPKEESVPLLIDIAKNNQNPELRKNAIFWLGQTGDEAALKFFEEILLKK